MRPKVLKNIRQVVLLAFIVFALRMLFTDFLSLLQEYYSFSFTSVFSHIFNNYFVVMVMLLGDIGIIHLLNNRFGYGEFPFVRLTLELVSLAVISTTGTIFIAGWQAFQIAPKTFFVQIDQFMPLFLGVSLLNLFVIIFTDILLYIGNNQKRTLDIEINKKNKARLQYKKLKHQLNPHFLFNSLNVLDYLVHTDADRASTFIKKLASIYRYLLNNEEEEIVLLENELKFAQAYFDLMKERFDKGLQIQLDIHKSYYDYYIIPCGLQILIENATKHNIVSAESPLRIDVRAEDEMIIVRNNLQPKLTRSPSMGMGLKNIEGQYQSMFGRTVSIHKTTDFFEVRIPLINQH
ncbi:MAG: sensor histidine kinase [Bacteroidales bacterium]